MTNYILIFTIPLMFALGWFMRGDKIYGGMYEQQINNIGLDMPMKDKINGK